MNTPLTQQARPSLTGHNTWSGQRGFTLVEMAIVMVVLGLLLGGILAPLSARQEQDRRDKNAALLDQAREALIGYALTNRRLPCPDTDGPGSPNSGVENNCPPPDPSAAPLTGRLPWVTLGIAARFDAWGNPHQIHYTVNRAFTSNNPLTFFTLQTAGTGNGIIEVHINSAACNTNNNLVALNVPALVWSSAKNNYASQGSVDEQENLNGDRCYVFREYNTVKNQEFDDQMVWLSPGILFNRMIEAGKLP